MSTQMAAPPAVAHTTFLNIRFARVDTAEASDLIAARPAEAPFAYVVTPNAAHVTRINETKDARFIAAYQAAWLTTMDSAVVRALARKTFDIDIPRAPGSDITVDLFSRHIKPDDAITIIGGSEEMLQLLQARYGLTNVAMHVPPMGFINRPAEVEACIDFVLAHPARYLFLVTGSPRSEYLAHQILQRGGAVGTGLCVGNSLNFLTGVATRAPELFRRWGIEWLHRLIFEPKVYIRRIFVDSLPLFVTLYKAMRNPAAYGMAPADKNGT